MAATPVRRPPFATLVLTALIAWGCSGGGSSSPAPSPPTPPAAPAAAAVAGDQQVTVSWAPVERAASYNLYWSTSPLPARSAWTRVSGVTSPHVLTGLANGVAVAMVVTAVSGEGLESADSAQAVATPGFPYGPPPAPTAVPRTQSVMISSAPPATPYVQLDLYWSTAPGVTKATGTRIENVSSCPACAVYYEHTGLERGRTYHYVFVGVLPDGRSGPESAEVSATVPFTTTFARLGPDGAPSWSRGVNDATGIAVAARPDGSFYVVGRTFGVTTFGAGEPNETTLRPPVTPGLFVARYTADGLLSWVSGSDGATVGGAAWSEGAVAATVLPDGSVAVTGSYSGNLIFAPGTAAATTLPQQNLVGDVFVARFLADGTLAWARSAGGSTSPWGSGHEGRAVVALSDGSVVVTGSFFGAITFPGTPGVTLTTTAGCNTNDFDVFVARYDVSGQLAWARRAGGCGWEEGLGIAAGPLDSVTVTGRFDSRPAIFGPGEPGETSLSAAILDTITYDVFLARYRADGSLAWADRAGGTDEDLGESLAATGAGVTVAGELRGPAVFGTGIAAASLPSGAFLARWSDAGTFSWARSIGVEGPVAIAPAPGGEAWLVGTLPPPPASLVLGAGEPGETTLLSRYLDVFAARYGAEGSLRVAVVLDRGPLSARGVAALADGSMIVLGNAQSY